MTRPMTSKAENAQVYSHDFLIFDAAPPESSHQLYLEKEDGRIYVSCDAHDGLTVLAFKETGIEICADSCLFKKVQFIPYEKGSTT